MITKNNKSALIGTLVLVALSLPMAVLAADKLIVKDAGGSANVFTVSDTGLVNASQVGIGTAAPAGQLDVTKEWPAKLTTNLLSVYTSYGDGSRLTVRSAMGTLGVPAATTSGLIGNVNFRGYDGSNFSASAVGVISAVAESTFTPTSAPTSVSIGTTIANTTAATEKLRITGDGRLRLSNQPAAPANNATCTVGDIILDAAGGFLYLCTSTNSWKRTAFASY